ncbi:MAG: 50S ribosomal protein L6 [Candidatus Paceibacterota bacterium]|jgi:large subunit ribosomal protein L6
MSKIGKQPIKIPTGVDVKLDNRNIDVKGPRGTMARQIPGGVGVEIKDDFIIVTSKNLDTKQGKALWGTWRALINNMVIGVTDGFKKVLEYKGVGYKAVVEGKNLNLELGFSHSIKMPSPDGIEFSTEKNTIIVSGIDKELVGQVAARIKKLRPPEPYKGAGIKYLGEIILRKEGKKSVSAGF